MKLLKEIKNMFEKLPVKEQVIFITIFGEPKVLNMKSHQEKQIIYNLLLWRTSQSDDV